LILDLSPKKHWNPKVLWFQNKRLLHNKIKEPHNTGQASPW
jgi:hypothetical protein